MKASRVFVPFLCCAALAAQGHKQWKLPISWDRYYDYGEVEGLMKRIAATWPDFVSVQSIGKSTEGRDLWLFTVANKKTGPESGKAAFYADANIHGNEVQGAETNLYLVWYLMEHYGKVKKITDLVDQRVLYVLPTMNVDGRAYWFDHPNTSSSSRSGLKPTDNDGDGRFDEDGPDDLDGDGEILMMRKKVPGEGNLKLDPDDPRLMIPCKPGEKGDYVLLGQEGIDNDGDGQINEDGPGGYDLNRNWPSGWAPNWIQFGAGDYPFSHPEPRAVGEFLRAHPNVAGVQAFHNAGGMILRGPGMAGYGEYPSADVAVYDELGRTGEEMLPFYRYMVIWRDLYTVWGGFVNWTYEGLGIFSFTNEQWNEKQLWQSDATKDQKAQMKWDDQLSFGENFVDWKPFKHPFYGDIELGGRRKMTGRVAPTFLIEEMLHRNAAFVIHHADQMPLLTMPAPEVEKLGDGLFAVTAKVVNSRLIPTRSAQAATKKIGRPDLFTVEGANAKVVAAGYVRDRFRTNVVDYVAREPGRLRVEAGVPSRGEVKVRFVVTGSGKLVLRYDAEKGGVVSGEVELR